MPPSLSQIQIRKATKEDSSSLQQLIQSVLNEYGLKYDPVNVDYDLENVEAHYPELDSRFYVAVFEGRIVGSAAIAPLDEKVPDSVLQKLNCPRERACELYRMYSYHEFRGIGLGKKLYSLLLQDALNLRYEWMFLETASQLREAQNLYIKLGFENFDLPNKTERCDLVMGKKI